MHITFLSNYISMGEPQVLLFLLTLFTCYNKLHITKICNSDIYNYKVNYPHHQMLHKYRILYVCTSRPQKICVVVALVDL